MPDDQQPREITTPKLREGSTTSTTKEYEAGISVTFDGDGKPHYVQKITSNSTDVYLIATLNIRRDLKKESPPSSISITQDSPGFEHAAFLLGDGYSTSSDYRISGVDLTQTRSGRYNKVWMTHAHNNRVTQTGPNDDSVFLSKDCANNIITQGEGPSYLTITPSKTTQNNQFDGGLPNKLQEKLHDNDHVSFHGKREDWSFLFAPDGSFTAFHKPTKTSPGTFKNYELVSFTLSDEKGNFISSESIFTEELREGHGHAMKNLRPADQPQANAEKLGGLNRPESLPLPEPKIILGPSK